MNKKIAYFILAHSDEKQLKRMIDRLDYRADFFIHIDKKREIEPFIDIMKDYTNVFFINNREKVYWGGFSIIKATINIINCDEYKIRKKNYIRVVLLSGNDYPLKPKEYIWSFFNINSNTQFINAINLKRFDKKTYNDFFKVSVEKYNVFDYPVFNNTSSLIFKLIRKIVNYILKIAPFSNKSNFEVFIGSQWWALTPSCIDAIMIEFNSNENKYKAFKWMCAPDEKFFHSLIYCTQYRNEEVEKETNNIIKINNNKDRSKQTSLLANLHLIHESLEKWYDFDDWEEVLKNKDKLFIRKVNSTLSNDLLDEIDNKLLDVE